MAQRDAFGNCIDDDVSSSASSIGTPKRVTSWATTTTTTEDAAPTKLPVEILKHGGLTTVHLPFNRQDAVDMRDALNSGCATYLNEHHLFNPKLLIATKRASGADARPLRALHFQAERSRSGTPNKVYTIAPGWTSLHHDGTFLMGKPIDICRGLIYAMESMVEYDGLDITLLDNGAEKKITIEELETENIIMMPPPLPGGKRLSDELERLAADKRAVESDLEAVRAELAALKKAKQ